MEQTIRIEQHLSNTTTLAEQEQDRKIEDTFMREQVRLRHFIRSRVSDELEAEDILQDVFYQLVETYRFMKPVEQVSAWLFKVARNKIIDMFRKKKPENVSSGIIEENEDGEVLSLLDLVISTEPGPETELIQNAVMEQLELGLEELPEEQRYVFLQHEVEGRSFKEISKETGITVNTLISRKRYAVLYLRERLEVVYNEFITD